MRRGSLLRWPMAVTGFALVAALLPLQFRPAPGSALYLVALAFSIVATAGVAAYYLIGPWTVPNSRAAAPAGAP